MALSNTVGDNEVVAVTQPFYGIGISGEALLLVTDSSLSDLSKLMAYDAADCEAELMLELASLLNGSCVHGFCEQLDIPVMLKHPVLYGQHYAIADLLREEQLPWQRTLAIELNYSFEGLAINCDLVLLFHEASLPKLFGQMALLLE
jgi:chemotaxis protein CheY-P-specific phosphatase CheC